MTDGSPFAGAGTGLDLPHVPAGVPTGLEVDIHTMDVRQRAFPEGVFDAVVLHLIQANPPPSEGCFGSSCFASSPEARCGAGEQVPGRHAPLVRQLRIIRGTMPRQVRNAGLLLLTLVIACGTTTEHDVVIRGGTVYDGSGAGGIVQDVAIDGDRIVVVGNLSRAKGRTEVDAKGLAVAPEGPFIKTSTHPRACGNFARLLGKYVRDEQVIPLAEAIRKLTAFPADTLGIKDRGRLAPGHFADVVVFDPATIADRVTSVNPHQYSVGL